MRVLAISSTPSLPAWSRNYQASARNSLGGLGQAAHSQAPMCNRGIIIIPLTYITGLLSGSEQDIVHVVL